MGRVATPLSLAIRGTVLVGAILVALATTPVVAVLLLVSLGASTEAAGLSESVEQVRSSAGALLLGLAIMGGSMVSGLAVVAGIRFAATDERHLNTASWGAWGSWVALHVLFCILWLLV